MISYLLLPVSLPYSGGAPLTIVDGFALYHAPDSRHDVLRFTVTTSPPLTLGESLSYASDHVEHIVARAMVFHAEVYRTRRERRRLARICGRRRAVPVPIGERQEVRIYAPDDAPQATVATAAEGRGVVLARAWRRLGKRRKIFKWEYLS